jgi:4-amino-4-deoxy-L-arabinose transferase-like glycosyltransferase
MATSADNPSWRARLTVPRTVLPWIPLLVLAFVLYAGGVDRNPPGYYLDEASISYNAYAISVDGHDEHGVAWPIFFQTWDASVAVNPLYVYILAVVFKLFGPSILAARLLSALAGYMTALMLGYVAERSTGNRRAGWIVALSALLMPWLFQVGRLVFEVALFPLVLAFVLLQVRRLSVKERWSPWEIAGLGLSLGLLTYTYTIGRLLGPLLAVGLLVMASRSRLPAMVATWVVFGVALVPALLFNLTAGGALAARAGLLGYITPEMSPIDLVATFLNHALANLDPRQMLLLGDPNIRHHVPVMGSVLAATWLLIIVGLDRVAHGGWRDPWHRYLTYGLLAALVPASLTIDDFHTLRLVALPVFGLLIGGIGIAWLDTGGMARRAALAALVALTLVQAAVFQWRFWQIGPERGYAFDEAFPAVFEAALSTGASPIYLRDRGDLPGYIEAYWYGTLRGMDRSAFVRLRGDELPPAGAIVLGTDKSCGACDVLLEDGDYIAYRAVGSSSAGLIPNGDFETVEGSTLGAFGSPIFGWSSSPNGELATGGAATTGAHLVLAHETDTTMTKQSTSAAAATDEATSLTLALNIRAAPSSPTAVRATVALVELDADHQFVTWHPVTVDLAAGDDWQLVTTGPTELAETTAFVNVSCYLEPGGAAGTAAEFDDVVLTAGD